MLVLLHSMDAPWWSWSRSIPLLEEHFSVCARAGLAGARQVRGEAGTVASVEHHAASLERLTKVWG